MSRDNVAASGARCVCPSVERRSLGSGRIREVLRRAVEDLGGNGLRRDKMRPLGGDQAAAPAVSDDLAGVGVASLERQPTGHQRASVREAHRADGLQRRDHHLGMPRVKLRV